MDLITIKEASKITSLSYSYIYENKIKLGFFKVFGKGKWLVDKKELEILIKSGQNSDRLTSKEVICQSRSVATRGTLILPRQMGQELDNLLARKTKRKPSNSMTN